MVASEIGTLADQSAVYVKEITEVVRSVKNAFENLASFELAHTLVTLISFVAWKYVLIRV